MSRIGRGRGSILFVLLVCGLLALLLGFGSSGMGIEAAQDAGATQTATGASSTTEGLGTAEDPVTTEAPTTETPTTTEPPTTTTEPVVITRYQQSDPRLTYLGFWYGKFVWTASGGSFYGTDAADAAVVIVFSGSHIELFGRTTPWCGQATITLDGVDETADFYTSYVELKRSVYLRDDLDPGPHTLVMTRSGAKNGRSSGYAINLDAFEIAGELYQAPADLGDGRVSGVLPKPEWFGLRLAAGSSGEAVAWLEQRLTELSYRPGPVDGYFDGRTRQAVIAFEKWEWLSRDGVVTNSVWLKLASASRPRPRYLQVGKWLEVNRSKQVLLYCVDGVVKRTLAVSTGSSSVGIVTPSGHYHITRKNTWERVRYKPLYLTWRLLAIHGYPLVPVYPASHGCIRITWADMDELHPLIPVGTSVRVY